MWSEVWPAFVIASGGLLSIGPLLLVTLLLSTPQGLRKASAFLLGYAGGYGVIGTLALIAGRSAAQSGGTDTPVAVILLVLGVLFVAMAIRSARRLQSPSKNLPRLFSSIDKMSARRALVIGLLITVINFKNLAIFLSAIGELGAVKLAYGLPLVPVVVGIFCVSSAAPVALAALFPHRAETWLGRLRSGLERYGRHASVVILLLFGAVFITRAVRILSA